MTFSIVAHDPATGQLGLAVQSRAFAVGRVIHHIHPGVGAVATQASLLAAHGERTLAAMVSGAAPAEALAASLDLDDERELRQVIAIDARGSGVAHTGAECIASAGHHVGDGFVVAGNILTNDDVVPAMVKAAADTTHPSLTRRLLAVLTAAQAAGGDLRGRQSASMIVVGPDDTGDPLVDRLVDVRIDDHADPIAELGRLVDLAEAYHDLERAEHLLLAGLEDGDDVGARGGGRPAPRHPAPPRRRPRVRGVDGRVAGGRRPHHRRRRARGPPPPPTRHRPLARLRVAPGRRRHDRPRGRSHLVVRRQRVPARRRPWSGLDEGGLAVACGGGPGVFRVGSSASPGWWFTMWAGPVV